MRSICKVLCDLCVLIFAYYLREYICNGPLHNLSRFKTVGVTSDVVQLAGLGLKTLGCTTNHNPNLDIADPTLAYGSYTQDF